MAEKRLRHDIDFQRSGELVKDCHSHQTAIMTTVRGKVSATYNHRRLSSSMIDIPNTENMKVPGKKTTVKAAMTFMVLPLAMASRAMVALVAVSC